MRVFKFVNSNYKSLTATYTGIDYSGPWPKEVRPLNEPSKKNMQCAAGIHVIPYDVTDFTNILYGPKVLELEVNEEDILFSEHGKMRVSKAVVIGEITTADIRDAFLATPIGAYNLAKFVHAAPTRETREICCKEPYLALEYARHIDQRPGELTREGASKNARRALDYAIIMDHGPHDVTREGACKQSDTALAYAKLVDKAPRKDTYAAAKGADREFYQNIYPSVLRWGVEPDWD